MKPGSLGGFLISAVKVVRFTHRHPANIGLHCVGLPMYLSGIPIAAGLLTWTTPAIGLGMIAAGISLLVLGHAIEGNVGTMTPVLLARLAVRSLGRGRHNPVQNRVHL